MINKKPELHNFELVLQVRDLSGNPTGKTKTIKTNSPSELEGFWIRNTGTKKKNASEPKKGKGNKNISAESKIRQKIVQKVEALKSLEKNWDDKNAPTINRNTISFCVSTLFAISDLLKFEPKVVPLSHGGLQLEFISNKTQCELELEFINETELRYLLWDPVNSIQEEKTLSNNQMAKIRELIIYISK